MADQTCPMCAKAVMGRSALMGHLEFSHDVEDPATYLDELEHPPKERRDLRRLRTGALLTANVVLVVVALSVGGALGSADASETSIGSSPSTAPPSAAPPATDPPETTVPPTTTVPTTTTVPPATTVSSTMPTSEVALSVADFRKPFLLDAEVIGCEAAAGVDTYEIGFVLSGARNVVLDGTPYPDDTGDGEHVVRHQLPSGSVTYLDRVDVADGAGNLHRVEITPPVRLARC